MKIKIKFHACFTGYLLVAMTFFCIKANAQNQLLPENPLKGRFVFDQKGCISCHAIKGDGGDIGPDLGHEQYYGSFLELAGIMLNHAPEMLRRMDELDLPYPEFNNNEMAEIIAYLYYLRYLGEPGDLYRGKVLVKSKGCLNCHSIRNKGAKDAPAFDKLAKYISPIYMAQALWNHGPQMDKKIQSSGLSRPTFEKGEIVDLAAYIREASRGNEKQRIFMSPGNPQRGKEIFKQKHCNRCHSKNEDDGGNMQEISLDMSVTEIAGRMWNHGTEMGELMQEKGIDWPRFNRSEMADLIAYMYFMKFLDDSGDAKKGKLLFSEKGCANCHGKNGQGTEDAPSLVTSNAISSIFNMTQIMWNHAPDMEEKATEKAIRWPSFSGNEMADLYRYLQQINTANQKQ